MRKMVFLSLSLIVFVLLSACGPAAPPNPADIGNIERGREIFETGGGVTTLVCANCHSLDGSILKEDNPAPSLQGIAVLASERVAGLSTVEYLEQSILDPGAFVVEGFKATMDSSYKYLLAEDDINALVAFLLTQ